MRLVSVLAAMVLLFVPVRANARQLSESSFVLKLVDRCAGRDALPGISRSADVPVSAILQSVRRQPRWKKLEAADKLERLEQAGSFARKGVIVLAIDAQKGGHVAVVVSESDAAEAGSELPLPATLPRHHGMGTWIMQGGPRPGVLPIQHGFPNLETVEYYVLSGHCGCRKPDAEKPCQKA